MIRKMLETKEVRKRCKLIAEYLSDDKHIAEDIMQTAFLEIWEKSADYKTEITTRLDFYRIFRKHSYNALRRLNTEFARYSEFTEDMSPEDHSRVDISSYIERLPEPIRGIMEMIAQGMTQDEIASNRGISQGYVSRHRNRGVNAIRSMIAAEGI